MTGQIHNISSTSDYSSNSSNDFNMDGGGGLRRLNANEQQHCQQMGEQEHNIQQSFDIPVRLLKNNKYIHVIISFFKL